MANLLLKLPTIVVTWGTFFLAGVLVYLVAALAGGRSGERKPFLKHFVADTWSHESAFTDVVVYLTGKVTPLLHAWAMPIITLFLAGLVAGGVHHAFPDHSIYHSNIFLLVLFALVLTLFSDFAGWLSHYAQHYVPVLWELHKVHHSAIFLNPLTARRGHALATVIDDVLRAVIMGLPTGLIVAYFKLNLAEITLLGVVANKVLYEFTLEALQHSHYPISFGPLEWLLVSPHMHHVHHSSRKEHWDKNFGAIFSIWDWMFGTAYKPQKGEFIVYGIGERETAAYQGIYGVYVLPIVGMWRVVARKTVYDTGPNPVKHDHPLAGILWRDAPSAPSDTPDYAPSNPGDFRNMGEVRGGAPLASMQRL